MRKKNILVTGGAGFIGGHLCKLLITGIKDHIKKKHKKDIPDNYVKNYLRVFVASIIENPSFNITALDPNADPFILRHVTQ